MIDHVRNFSLLRLLPGAVLVALLLAVPMLTASALGGTSATIEAPELKNKGVGFVLMVSLQRG